MVRGKEDESVVVDDIPVIRDDDKELLIRHSCILLLTSK